MSVSDSVNDLMVLVNELIDNLGAKNVADGMDNQGWLRPDDSKIEAAVRDYFENEVFEDKIRCNHGGSLRRVLQHRCPV